MSEPQKSKRFELPADFDESDRDIAATLIKEAIVKRTENNMDVNGKRFANYSQSYANSLEFKLAKKDRNDPNLELTGDMLNSLQTLESGPGYVSIGYREGTPENDKAVWAERSDNGPSRKFLGLMPSELEQVIAEVRLNKADNPELNQAIQTTTTDKAINSILRSMGIGDDEEP